MLLGVTGNTDTKYCFGCKNWLVDGQAAVTYLGKWSEGCGEQILLWCLSCGMGKKKLWYPAASRVLWLFNYEIHSETIITEYWPWSFSGWEGEGRERVLIVTCKSLFVALQSYMGCSVLCSQHVSQNRWNCQFRKLACHIQSYVCYCTVSPYFEHFNV